MSLPAKIKEYFSPITIASEDKELQVKQAESLASIASSFSVIASFLQSGGLANVLSGYARIQSVNGILEGLASHDGRKSLDPRMMDQNALEMFHAVEKAFNKHQEKLERKEKGNEDEETHDAEKSYKTWKEKNGFKDEPDLPTSKRDSSS